MTKAMFAYAILGFCFGMLTVIVANAIATKLTLKRVSKTDKLSKDGEIKAEIVDLRTCKKGDSLLTKAGIYFMYLDSDGARRFPHRAALSGIKASFTNSGRFKVDKNREYDVVRILHLSGDQK